MPTLCRWCVPLVIGAALLGSAHKACAQGRSRSVFPTARFDLGPLFLVTGVADRGFVAHISAGAGIGWPGYGIERYFSPSLWLYPEVSYEYRDVSQQAGHTASAGVGIGWGNLIWGNLGYTPRIVAGVVGEDAAVGFRHGLYVRLFMTLLNLELSHQLLSAGGSLSHELQVTAGLNLGTLKFLFE